MGATENKALLTFAQKLFPKSRWGNVAYLIVGLSISNYDNIVEIVQSIIASF